MTAVKLSLTPLRSGILSTHNSVIPVLVRVQAPMQPGEMPRRQPLNLSLVLDRSGSMGGAPMHEARRCADFIINNLLPTDRASVVVYDNEVDVLVPNQPVSDRSVFHAAIAGVYARGATALYDGWRLGADQTLFGHQDATRSSVMLISDGQANQGMTGTASIAARCAQVFEAGVTTSTYGLGHHFNEELMVEMGRAGGGNAYYGESAEDLMDPVREELELLNATCATGLRLNLETPDGVGLKVLNNYTPAGESSWRLPDLAHGGEAWALVELSVSGDLEAPLGGREIEILRATLDLEYREDGAATVGPEVLRLPFLPAGAFAALAEDELVRRRQQEVRAAELQDAARTAARRQDWQQVDALLAQAKDESRDNPWLAGVLESLGRYARKRQTEQFSKEAMFSAGKLRSRLADVDEMQHAFLASAESVKPAFIRRKLEQGKRMEGRRDADDV